MRTIVEVLKEDIQQLDNIASRKNRSQASVVREAIALYLSQNQSEAYKEQAFGIWKKQPKEGLKYQQSLREEWERNL